MSLRVADALLSTPRKWAARGDDQHVNSGDRQPGTNCGVSPGSTSSLGRSRAGTRRVNPSARMKMNSGARTRAAGPASAPRRALDGRTRSAAPGRPARSGRRPDRAPARVCRSAAGGLDVALERHVGRVHALQRGVHQRQQAAEGAAAVARRAVSEAAGGAIARRFADRLQRGLDTAPAMKCSSSRVKNSATTSTTSTS